MTPTEQLQLLAVCSQVFRPSAPISKVEMFAGRFDQMMATVNAINQPGQHVMLYGERGVGKTSLAQTLFEVLSPTGSNWVSASVNCDRSDTFSSLWHKILKRLAVDYQKRQIGLRNPVTLVQVGLDAMLPDDVKPDDVLRVLSLLSDPLIIIIDEFDTVQGSETTSLMADTIKALSDHALEITLVVVGVADSVDELIHEHQSIERALVQVLMPRMSQVELGEILTRGCDKLGMTIKTEVMNKITRLSQGLPHYTHLLALHSTQEAIRLHRLNVEMSDLNTAIQHSVTSVQSHLSAYHRAITCPQKKNVYREVLTACALAPKDVLGYFSAASVKHPMSKIMGVEYQIPAFARHLNEFADAKRGDILKKSGNPRRYRYRFTNPMMQPFVILRGLSDDLISDSLIEECSADSYKIEIDLDEDDHLLE